MSCELEVTVRILSLNKFQAVVLTKEIEGATYREHSNKIFYVGYIPLTESTQHDILNFIERQKIDMKDTDIFLSVASENYSEVVHIPNQVNSMLKLADFKLTMSFTCLPD